MKLPSCALRADAAAEGVCLEDELEDPAVMRGLSRL